MKLGKAIFMDRDGVISKLLTNHEDRLNLANYIISWDQFEFCDGALEALAMLNGSPYDIIVVSNQSGISKGLIEYPAVRDIFDKMNREIEKAGGHITQSLFCPHAPEDNCFCRKPQPAMLFYAAFQWRYDLRECWMIGDSESDMVAAGNAHIPAGQRIFLKTEYNESAWEVESLVDAVAYIIQTDIEKHI